MNRPRLPIAARRRTLRGSSGVRRLLFLESLEDRRLLADISAPPILQWFESSYGTIENRVPDVFVAGYGSAYTPPPGRADQGNFSVGYDPYDRFDLGKPGNPTLYGTETGLKTLVAAIHRAAADYYIDFVINHDGYSDNSSVDGQGHSFYNAGGYPGLNITLPTAVDGDFHGAFETGDLNGRLAGLIDINHSTNFQMIRSPVDPIAPNNIRAGTQSAFGRIANVPDPNNARFYPDHALQPIMVYDPNTGEGNIPIYPFNNGNPLAGDATAENAMGYLMRNAQWLVQAIGVDGLRIDAAKHVESFVLNYLDRALYRSSFRGLLNGDQKEVFSFSEVFDGDSDTLQGYVRKPNPNNNIGVIDGNRDVLDFPLFFALKANLAGDVANSWYNIRNASFDLHDDGLHNGSQGVMFVQSHDENGPYLDNVAYAYMLTQPGNAIVYFNGKEFGDNRDFPKNGRGDALGGLNGNAITTLVSIRDTHGSGDYIERWIDGQNNFAYERDKSMVVMLSSTLNPGYPYDSRTLLTNFQEGTKLIELTGNAADPFVDPGNNIPEVVVVNADHTINVRFVHNVNSNGQFTGKGYLIYGPATPQGTLSLTNVAQVLAGGTPTPNTNGTTRLANLDVITGNTFQVQLNTNQVNLLSSIRDAPADGDNALLKIDEGLNVNGNGQVDYRTPSTPSYGFEEFVTKKSPLWGGGDGQFRQDVDATQLAEGTHFITVRAFRHREDSGPAVFTDFKKAIYVDRLAPVAAIDNFNPIVQGVNENRRLQVRSTDLTANNVHVFFDLPAGLTQSQILAMVGGGSQTTQIDRDLFTKDATNLTSGNHATTVVTYEQTGNFNVQRFAGLYTSTIFGAGLGDLDYNGAYNTTDVTLLGDVLFSNNGQFNPAGDLNGDGLIDNADLQLLGPRLTQVGANGATMQAYNDLVASVATVGNYVWLDANHNGVQDGGEQALAGVTVRLLNDSFSVLSTATTDAAGHYSFFARGPATDVIEVVAPASYSFSPRDQGGNDSLDSDADPATGRTALFAIVGGQNDSSQDVGLFDVAPTVSIANVTPSPRLGPINQITITFSEAVNGFGPADLQLKRNGGANLLTGDQTLTTSNNIVWTLGNLAGVTNVAGSYTLSLTAAVSGIVDLTANPLANNGSVDFIVDPTVVVINTDNSGDGSLRQAIMDINAAAGMVHTITFNIPGTGPYPIESNPALPNFVDPVIITVAAGKEVKISMTSAFTLGDYSLLTKSGGGTLTIGGTQNHAAATLTVEAGVLNLNSDGGTNLWVNANATTNFGSSQHLAGLSIGSGNVVTLTAGGGKVLSTDGLSIAGTTNAWTGRLDLADNDLVFQSTAAAKAADLARLANQLKAGMNAGGWNGNGIASSAAAADGAHLSAIGVLLNANALGAAIYNFFSGQGVNTSSILAKYTYVGDANLSGAVDGSDYAMIDNGFNFGLSGWANGDFNYSATIDGTDYALIDNAFNNQAAPLAAELAPIDPLAFALAVPPAATPTASATSPPTEQRPSFVPPAVAAALAQPAPTPESASAAPATTGSRRVGVDSATFALDDDLLDLLAGSVR